MPSIWTPRDASPYSCGTGARPGPHARRRLTIAAGARDASRARKRDLMVAPLQPACARRSTTAGGCRDEPSGGLKLNGGVSFATLARVAARASALPIERPSQTRAPTTSRNLFAGASGSAERPHRSRGDWSGKPRPPRRAKSREQRRDSDQNHRWRRRVTHIRETLQAGQPIRRRSYGETYGLGLRRSTRRLRLNGAQRQWDDNRGGSRNRVRLIRRASLRRRDRASRPFAAGDRSARTPVPISLTACSSHAPRSG